MKFLIVLAIAAGCGLQAMHAQGAGGHYIHVIPSLNAVIVNQYDNEPDAHTSDSVLHAAQNPHQMWDTQFGHLVKLILSAESNG